MGSKGGAARRNQCTSLTDLSSDREAMGDEKANSGEKNIFTVAI